MKQRISKQAFALQNAYILKVKFFAVLSEERLPRPEVEHKFHPERNWRFDYAWVEQKVALEVEGGVWSGGRHVRGSGFLNDMEKYNAATVLGWRLLRTTPSELCKRANIDALKNTLWQQDINS